jgi:hypothetical protein
LIGEAKAALKRSHREFGSGLKAAISICWRTPHAKMGGQAKPQAPLMETPPCTTGKYEISLSLDLLLSYLRKRIS